MEPVYFKEVFEYPIKEFKEHLENPLNERIIFSGKYGIGKTKFLQEFFSEKNQAEIFESVKYEAYRLFPVNYSIASNEDIIRYIKYDIIIEMLRKPISFNDIKLHILDTLPEYVKDNFNKVVAAMIYMIPKLGKEVVECFEKIDNLKEEFLKSHDESNKTPGDKLIEYLEKIEMRDGSIYENDITTKIISEIINRSENVRSVLIIDDIDRLDPEHVFRILNVFAAHFDNPISRESNNKFNFDKIIIVCDFHNIRNLFHYRYGNEVDFMGYIDKFYSSDIYYFDNKKAVKEIVKSIFGSVQIKLRKDESENTVKELYFKDEFLILLVTLLIDRNFISLRNIIKIHEKPINYHALGISFDKRNYDIPSWQVPVAMQFKLLRDFLGDYTNMKRVFEKCSINNEFIENFNFYFGFLIFVLSSEIHNFDGRDDFQFDYREIRMICKLKFSTRYFNGIELYEYKVHGENATVTRGNVLHISIDVFWNALIDTIEKLHKIGYIT